MVAVCTDRGYQQKISVAEAAVAGMTDPQLKQVAFAKILEQLLAESAGVASGAVKIKGAPTGTAQRQSSVGRGGPVAHIEELIADGFFGEPRTLGDVRTELANRGHHIPRTSLSGPLQLLCQRKVLRRMKHRINGSKEVFGYSIW